VFIPRLDRALLQCECKLGRRRLAVAFYEAMSQTDLLNMDICEGQDTWVETWHTLWRLASSDQPFSGRHYTFYQPLPEAQACVISAITLCSAVLIFIDAA
jgi:hypothetical protein